MASSPSFVSQAGNLQKYFSLDQKGTIIAEYIWIDSEGGTRSKSRTLPEKDYQPEDLPVWNFDGSSTGQAPGDNSDVYLKPVAIYPDPIRLGKNILVLSECWDSDGTPNKYNYRHETAKLMTAHAEHIPWFGLEQEYTLLDLNDRPYGWPQNGFPAPQGPYYCGVGAGKVVQRDIVEAHYRACLYAGIKISGTNAEVMPAQWEFQIAFGGYVRLFDARKYDKGPFEIFSVGGDISDANVVKFSNDGRLMLLTTMDGHIHVLDSFRGTLLSTYNVKPVSSTSTLEASFSPEGMFVISGSGDGSVYAWSVRSGKEVASWMSTETEPPVIKWAPGSLMFVTGSSELSFWIPDLSKLGAYAGRK